MNLFVEPAWKIPLRRVLKSILLGCFIVLALELGFHLIAAPNLRIQKVYVSGDDRNLTNQDLLDLLGLRPREYYFSISEPELEARLSQVPWIRLAKVTKDFPDTLRVKITARDPLALALDETGGRTLVLSVDANGVIFDVSPLDAHRDLPIVSGVTFESLKPGIRFPDALKSLFQSLASLRKDSPGLFAQISEIRVRRTEGEGFESLIYPVRGDIRIIMPEEWSEMILRQAFVLLDVIDKEGWSSKTKEIDFRTTPVVVRPRES